MSPPPVILTIAGFDPCGGAGILADVKAIHANGGHAIAVTTAQTVQNTCGIRTLWPEPVEGVRAQLEALQADLPIAAVKIGMLAHAAMIDMVVDWLTGFDGPIVVDPVLRSTSGHTLLSDAPTALDTLLQRATLITPNLPEARILTDRPDACPEQLLTALQSRFGGSILLKGGHGEGAQLCDRLMTSEGRVLTFCHPRQTTTSTHGTGCLLASAITTQLARDLPLPAAAHSAIDWLQRQLAHSPPLGRGIGPVHVACTPDT